MYERRKGAKRISRHHAVECTDTKENELRMGVGCMEEKFARIEYLHTKEGERKEGHRLHCWEKRKKECERRKLISCDGDHELKRRERKREKDARGEAHQDNPCHPCHPLIPHTLSLSASLTDRTLFSRSFLSPFHASRSTKNFSSFS